MGARAQPAPGLTAPARDGTLISYMSIKTYASLLALLVTAGCVSPSSGARQLDRTIRAELKKMELPRAERSTLDPLAADIRVTLKDGVVKVDDVAVWSAVPDTKRAREREPDEPRARYSRSAALRLGPAPPPDGSSWAQPELTRALEAAKDGARAGREAAGEEYRGRYTIYADARARFGELVAVMYNAGRLELRQPSLAVRGRDGELAALPISIPKFCAIERDDARAHHELADCYEPRVTVIEDVVALRGRASHPRGECMYAMRATDLKPTSVEMMAAWKTPLTPEEQKELHKKLGFPRVEERAKSESESGSESESERGSERESEPAPPAAPPPPPPCRALTIADIERDPEVMRAAIAELHEGLDPCPQTTLTASFPTRWQAVITVFDALRSLGYERVVIEAGAEDPEPCVSPPETR